MTFSAPYFLWLYAQIYRHPGEDPKYRRVCRLMNDIVFDDSVPNDSNRSAEGIDLRFEFTEKHQPGMDAKRAYEAGFFDSPATLFEVLIALARRCEFQMPQGRGVWFYIFLKNLGLHEVKDGTPAVNGTMLINRKLLRFNGRHYSERGEGSIFPLNDPLRPTDHSPRDMREVELWYQMSAYIIQNHML